jgi:hypothetical protein
MMTSCWGRMIRHGAERQCGLGGRRIRAAGFDIESEGAAFSIFGCDTNRSCLTLGEALREEET